VSQKDSATRLHLFCIFTSVLLFFFTQCSDTSENIDSAVSRVSNPKTTKNSWIEDSTGILNNSQDIDALISQNEASTGVEIAVVILPTIDSYVPKDFAVALFNHWGIGKKGKDNGILILHVLDQRRIEIETGYGIEGDLPDVVVKRIIDTYTIPAFKADDFSKGHFETVSAIITKLNNPKLEIEQLVTGESSTITEELTKEEQAEIPVRTDLYDYKGKSYLQLTEEEKQIFDSCIEKYNSTSDYFLTDEESRLLEERTTELTRIERENSAYLKLSLLGGYVSLLAALFLLTRLLYFIIPSPDFKYRIIKHSDFPIFYGAILSPVITVLLIVSHFWEEAFIFVSFFVGIASFILFNLFWGDLRLERLSKRLLKIRSIPRKCPKCRQLMVKLSEKEDNTYLSKGQIAEEIIKSIDYDVWVCPACNENEILPFPNLDPEFIFKGTSFKKIKKCPECKFETFLCSESHILSAATYSSSGKVEVLRKCKHCKHELTEYEIIPKKQKSSSGSSSSGGSSGGSFGGGSSGGGGSGGSY